MGEPIAKKLCSSLKKTSKKHPWIDFSTSEADMERHRKGFGPQNTKASNDWAVQNFEVWREARKASKPHKSCPGVLLSDYASQVDCWLCFYLVETREEDGSPYSPKMFCLLLAGLQP